MTEIIKNKIGNSFPSTIYLVGLIATLSSIMFIVKNPILAIILLLVGLFICTSSFGTEIDIKQRKYREYGSIYGLKRGKWLELSSMPYLTVLKSRSGYTIYSRSNRSTTNLEDFYDVCLLNQSHRKKVILMKFKKIDEAIEYAKKIENILELTFAKFDPVISEKTANRRK